MYAKKQWADHSVQKPRTYTVVENVDGSLTLTPAPGTVYQQGTAMNAVVFNNAERGIADAHVASSIFAQFFLNFRRWVVTAFTTVYASMVRVDTAQTLTSGQKLQGRTNISAQETITASGLLKGSGTAVSAAAAGTDYADLNYVAVSDVSNAFACDVASKKSVNFNLTIGNTTAKTLTVANLPAGRCEIFLEITATAAAAMTWTLNGGSLAWATSAPAFEAGKVYRVQLITTNTGANWDAYAALGVA